MKNFAVLFWLSIVIISCSRNPTGTTAIPANPFFQTASTFRDAGVSDSAYFYFNLAKDLYLQQKDSTAAGVCMINMAIISTDTGDWYGGQELSLEANSYFDESKIRDHPYLLSNMNNLGIAAYNLKKYEHAVSYYTQSLSFNADSAYARVIQNNIANAYRKQGDYANANAIYRSVLPKEKDSVNYARLLSNYAYTQWLENRNYNAGPELRRALNIRKLKNDAWGLNASYAQLSDYYTLKQPDSSLLYADQMYRAALKLHSVDDQLEALEKLIPLTEDHASKTLFRRYRLLQDSIQTVRANAKNQFVLIRYETERHKTANLRLQQESTVRAIWIASLTVFIAMGVVATLVWYRRKKRRLQQEAEAAVRESQLKTSKKVHDVVANGLYRIMSEMENNAQTNQEKILDDMEILYEQSRDISYDNEYLAHGDARFRDDMKKLLISFAASDIKIAIAGNDHNTWQRIPSKVMYEVKHVMQELMINMKKHSRASAVSIIFEKTSQALVINYRDNGIGFPSHIVSGNGMRNTGNRIKSIGGTISFESDAAGGAKILIRIPVAE